MSLPWQFPKAPCDPRRLAVVPNFCSGPWRLVVTTAQPFVARLIQGFICLSIEVQTTARLSDWPSYSTVSRCLQPPDSQSGDHVSQTVVAP